jgi:hypothetical protein
MKRKLSNIFLGVLMIIYFTVLLSCSPQKRMARLLKHHPELLTKDTLIIRDTFVIKQSRVDTAFFLHQLYDTVTIEKNNVITQLFIHRDSIFINQVRKADTIFIEKRIPVEKIISPKKEKSRDVPVWVFIAVVLLFLVIGLVKSFRN